MFGLPGPNGAGKFTLMTMLATQEPDEGSIRCGDIHVRRKDKVRDTRLSSAGVRGLLPAFLPSGLPISRQT
jgi:ABC-type multidrug transport system ATPase subunit